MSKKMRGDYMLTVSLLVVLLVVMLGSVSAASKIDVCNVLNLTTAVDCDDWWEDFDEGYEVIGNFTIIEGGYDYCNRTEVNLNLSNLTQRMDSIEVDKQNLQNYLMKTDHEILWQTLLDDSIQNGTLKTEIEEDKQYEWVWKGLSVLNLLIILVVVLVIVRMFYE